jgi:hypothetical protein
MDAGLVFINIFSELPASAPGHFPELPASAPGHFPRVAALGLGIFQSCHFGPIRTTSDSCSERSWHSGRADWQKEFNFREDVLEGVLPGSRSSHAHTQETDAPTTEAVPQGSCSQAHTQETDPPTTGAVPLIMCRKGVAAKHTQAHTQETDTPTTGAALLMFMCRKGVAAIRSIRVQAVQLFPFSSLFCR